MDEDVVLVNFYGGFPSGVVHKAINSLESFHLYPKLPIFTIKYASQICMLRAPCTFGDVQ